MKKVPISRTFKHTVLPSIVFIFIATLLLQGCSFEKKTDMEVATEKVENLFDGDFDQFFQLDHNVQLKHSVDQDQISDAQETVEKLDLDEEDELELIILYSAVHFAEMELAAREDGSSNDKEEEVPVYVPEKTDVYYDDSTLINKDVLEAFIETAGENGDDNESNIRVVRDEGKHGVILYDLQSRYDENVDQRWIEVYPYLEYFNTATSETQDVFNNAPQQCSSMSKEYDFYMMNECRTNWEYPLIPVEYEDSEG